MCNVMQLCLSLEADARPTCSQLLRHELFTGDGFAANITRQLRTIVCREYESNPLTAQTMRHRYERCRQQLQKTSSAQPVTDETHRRQSADSDTYQPNKVNDDVLLLGRFLPREAMLARYLLSSCPSVDRPSLLPKRLNAYHANDTIR